MQCVLLATRGRCAALCPIGHYGALRCTANIGHQVALWSSTLYRPLWGSPPSPLVPPHLPTGQGGVEPMGFNALLSTMGRCGALCPIGHYGALWSTVSYWPLWGAVVQYVLPPLWGAVVHCVLLATRGRCGAPQILATRWRYGAQRSIEPYGALWGSPTSPLFPPQNNQGKVVQGEADGVQCIVVH